VQNSIFLKLPAVNGSYILVLFNEMDRDIQVGRKGRFGFSSGYYLYFGSARGPGGIRGRVSRHLSEKKKLHWHIDYLSAQMQMVGLGYIEGESNYECEWSHQAIQSWQMKAPVPDLGASDCQRKCLAHFFFMPDGMQQFPILTQDFVFVEMGSLANSVGEVGNLKIE